MPTSVSTYSERARQNGYKAGGGLSSTHLLRAVLEDLADDRQSSRSSSPLHARVAEALPRIEKKHRRLLSAVFGLEAGQPASTYAQLAKEWGGSSESRAVVSYKSTRAMQALREAVWGKQVERDDSIEQLARITSGACAHDMDDGRLGRILDNIAVAGPEAVMKAGGLPAAILQGLYDLPEQEFRVLTAYHGMIGGKRPSMEEAKGTLAPEMNEGDIFAQIKRRALFFLRDAVVAQPHPEDADIQEFENVPVATLDEGDRFPSPEDLVERGQRVAHIAVLIDKEIPFNAEVLRRRLGAEEGGLKTIGDDYNLSRERIRQIQEGSVLRIRDKGQRCNVNDKVRQKDWVKPLPADWYHAP